MPARGWAVPGSPLSCHWPTVTTTLLWMTPFPCSRAAPKCRVWWKGRNKLPVQQNCANLKVKGDSVLSSQRKEQKKENINFTMFARSSSPNHIPESSLAMMLEWLGELSRTTGTELQWSAFSRWHTELPICFTSAVPSLSECLFPLPRESQLRQHSFYNTISLLKTITMSCALVRCL